MKRDNVTLKTYFETGDYPTEAQFADLIDSFLNIEEEDAVTGITNNGDGTYSFQLLSGGIEVIDVGNLSNNVPISSVVGLQAILDALPSQYLRKNQDENTTGNLSIDMGTFSNSKQFSVGAQGQSAYQSLNVDGNAIFGAVSTNDGQDSHIVVKRNGGLEFNDRGTVQKIWHEGNDGSGSGLDADTLDGIQAGNFVRDTLGVSAAEANRDVKDTGIYTYNVNSNPLGGSTPDTYWSVLTWGRGTGGSAQIAANWISGGNELWFRSLRDTTDNWWNWKKIWHSGNDGGGSGLDADLVDGLQASVFVRNDGNAGTRFGSNYLQFNGDGASNNDYIAYNDATNAYYFNADSARQNTTANAAIFAQGLNGDFLKVGGNQGNANTVFTDYNAPAYSLVMTSNTQGSTNYPGQYGQAVFFRGATEPRDFAFWRNNSNDNDDIYVGHKNGSQWEWNKLYHNGEFSIGDYWRLNQRQDGKYAWIRRNSSGNSPLYLTQQSSAGDIQRWYQGAGDGTLYTSIQNKGHLAFYNSARIRRYSHVGGFLEGSYNTVGGNANQSNPIYVIGSSYLPSNTSLGNMYGVGFSNGSASFLNSTDLGTNPSGWGLYIASDGNARIFLNASNGHGYFGGNVYADNFILSSDRRLKDKIKPLKNSFTVDFVEFEMKKRKGDKRYGVIAQDVEQEHPELVYTDEEGTKQVKYIDLLIGKVAELEQRIKMLEKN